MSESVKLVNMAWYWNKWETLTNTIRMEHDLINETVSLPCRSLQSFPPETVQLIKEATKEAAEAEMKIYLSLFIVAFVTSLTTVNIFQVHQVRRAKVDLCGISHSWWRFLRYTVILFFLCSTSLFKKMNLTFKLVECIFKLHITEDKRPVRKFRYVKDKTLLRRMQTVSINIILGKSQNTQEELHQNEVKKQSCSSIGLKVWQKQTC